MRLIPGVQVLAVAAGSSKEKAEGFAEEHGKTLFLSWVEISRLDSVQSLLSLQPFSLCYHSSL